MADAQSNAAQIGFALETTYAGTIPAAPLKRLRLTEDSIAHQKNAQWSNEINANGDRTSVIDISKSSAGQFTSELSFTDFVTWLPAAMRAGAGVVTGDVTRYTNANVLKSFYFEKQFTDISAFVGAYGLVIGGMTLTLTANEIAQVSFDMMGKYLKKETVSRGTGPIAAASTDQIMRSGADVANLTLGGSAFPASVQSLTLTINNNLRPKTELTADSPTLYNIGSFDVTGSMRVYFPTLAMFDLMIAHTAQGMTFDVENAAGRFGFVLPSIQLSNVSPNIGAINQDVMLDIPFMATRGVSDAFTIALDVEPA
jgi:hypothetical protein